MISINVMHKYDIVRTFNNIQFNNSVQYKIFHKTVEIYLRNLKLLTSLQNMTEMILIFLSPKQSL